MALSFVKYTGTGTQVQFIVPFAYISKLHVFVFVDDVSVPFVWVNNGLIQTTTAPADQSVVEVRRDTPISEPLVDFEDGGTLNEEDLDAAALQALYHNQEQADDIDDSIRLTFAEEWDALNKPMKNLADPATPTSVTDAINIGFLNTALVGSNNVPVPLDPADDGKTLIAATGSWSWVNMLVANLSDVVAVMQTFIKSASLSAARTNLGLGSAAVENTGTLSTEIPKNSDLGTASIRNTGTAAGDVPLLTATGMPVVSGNKMTFAAFDSAFNENQGANIASAATTDIGAATGNFVDVTGVVTITSLGTVAAGTERTVRFTGAGLIITHHAVALICLSGVNITTATDDIAVFRSLGAGNWVMVDYVRKTGESLVGASAGGLASISNDAITAVTNIDVTGFAPATYDNYEVWISNGRPGTDTNILEMETSTDGGTSFDTGASDYTWAYVEVGEAGTVTGLADADDAEIIISQSVGGDVNENVNIKIAVHRPEATEFTTFIWQTTMRANAANFVYQTGGGDRQSAGDVDALRFHFATGNWAAQGNIQFLGIAQ